MAVRPAPVLKAPRKARLLPVGPATDVAAARRAALGESLEQVAANVPGALAGADPEYLHQLRVGMRRLRAALHVFEGTVRPAEARALRRALAELGKVTGPARDWDVIARRVPPALRERAARRRSAAQAALRRVLRAMRLLWLVPRGLPAARQPLAAFARPVLDRLERKATRRGARVDWSRAGKRHALRIRLRRLRYACEFLRGAFPARDAEPLIRSLRQLQDLLGELNDMAVARRLLREMNPKGGRRSTGGRERKLVAQLPAAWRSFARAPRFWNA